MALTPGTRLGVYEITAPIGEGEWARSTGRRTRRWVARSRSRSCRRRSHLTPNAWRVFEREAKTLASPNHPHIAAIYAVEKSAGMHALVMELVEGEDLSRRIARSAIPLHAATSHSEWSVAPVSCSTSAPTGVDFVHVDQ